jgi:cytochrome b561
LTVTPVDPNFQRYDTVTIILHWLVAIMVAALWIGAETIDWFPQGPLRADARSLHISLGFLLGAIGGGRFVWRLSFGRPLPPADAGVLGTAANVTHQGLYALLAVMVFVGMLLLWASGDSVFNYLDSPLLDPDDRALAARLQHAHAVIGWVILAAVGLHVVAVLYHYFVLHDTVLGRMLPGRPAGRR